LSACAVKRRHRGGRIARSSLGTHSRGAQTKPTLSLARVAIAAGIHSPERAHDMVARMREREEDLTVWIRAAAADGRLKTSDPRFASQQLQGIVKAFAFLPQVTMGQPRLSKDEQRQVAESAADMFLARYE
jgi:TetR/AcrR family transcriptional regulator, regulator of autoinduction and epiphytic fitness